MRAFEMDEIDRYGVIDEGFDAGEQCTKAIRER